MKVGNLVSVKRTHGREPVIGVIIAIKADLFNTVAIVESIKGNYQIYANPLDIEVISDCR
mgnify:FL=1|tara:strand:+ start:374 stop:553 length:180 start_codon:yes stop_codon:yes gene_type:complete